MVTTKENSTYQSLIRLAENAISAVAFVSDTAMQKAKLINKGLHQTV